MTPFQERALQIVGLKQCPNINHPHSLAPRAASRAVEDSERQQTPARTISVAPLGSMADALPDPPLGRFFAYLFEDSAPF